MGHYASNRQVFEPIFRAIDLLHYMLRDVADAPRLVKQALHPCLAGGLLDTAASAVGGPDLIGKRTWTSEKFGVRT